MNHYSDLASPPVDGVGSQNISNAVQNSVISNNSMQSSKESRDN